MADDSLDLDSLILLEQKFFDAGFEDGFAHGCIHGRLEGRTLGKEKGFEIWQELGCYEGFALVWREIYTDDKQASDNRVSHHISHLLDLISQFPRVNPSPLETTAGESVELDLPKLLQQIRSRYKVLCSAFGIKPSLRVSVDSLSLVRESTPECAPSAPRPSVWALNNRPNPHSRQDLSF